MITRTYLPDIRCLCGKVLLNSVRQAYLTFVKNDLNFTKLFMEKHGITRACCMDSLMNIGSYPNLQDKKIEKINEVYKDFKKRDIRPDLRSLFDSAEMLYEYPTEIIKEKFMIADSMNDIIEMVKIIKDLEIKPKDRHPVVSIDLDKNTETYRKKYILEIATDFLQDKEQKPNAPELLTQIYTTVFPNRSPKKSIKTPWSKEQIELSKKNYIKLLKDYGNYPLFADLNVEIYNNRILTDVDRSVLLETLKDSRKYTESDSTLKIFGIGYETIINKTTLEFTKISTTKDIQFDFNVFIRPKDEILQFIKPKTNIKSKILNDLTFFKYFKDIDYILNTVEDHYTYLLKANDTYIKKNKLDLKIVANDNDELLKVLGSIDITEDHRNFIKKSIRPDIYSNIDRTVFPDTKLFFLYGKNAVKSLSFGYLYNIYNKEKDFVNKVEQAAQDLEDLFNWSIDHEISKTAKLLFNVKDFVEPDIDLLEVYDQCLESPDPTLEEAWSYLVTNKELPKVYGYSLDMEDEQTDQIELAEMIEKGI